MSALFRWPCSVSIHLSPRSVTAGVRPFPAGDATFLFICLVGLSLVVSAPGHVAFLFMCLPGLSCWPPFSAGDEKFLFIPQYVGFLESFSRCVRPFYHCWCPPISSVKVISVLLSPRFGACTAWCPPFSAGHAAFLFICLPGDFCTSPNRLLLGALSAF